MCLNEHITMWVIAPWIHVVLRQHCRNFILRDNLWKYFLSMFLELHFPSQIAVLTSADTSSLIRKFCGIFFSTSCNRRKASHWCWHLYGVSWQSTNCRGYSSSCEISGFHSGEYENVFRHLALCSLLAIDGRFRTTLCLSVKGSHHLLNVSQFLQDYATQHPTRVTCRVFDKLIVANKEIPDLLWNSKFHCRFHWIHQWTLFWAIWT